MGTLVGALRSSARIVFPDHDARPAPSFRGALKARTRKSRNTHGAVITGLVPVIPLRMARQCPPKQDSRDMRGHDGGEAIRPAFISVLTLILYDIIPSDVRSARGRSHEASRGWDRMRRPRPGGNATSRTRAAPGLRPAANTSCPPGAWPFGGRNRPPAPSPMGEAGAGRTDGSRKARPGAVGKTPAMARHEAPAFSRGSAASNEQWLRHLARQLPRFFRGTRETPADPAPKKYGR